MSDPQAPPTLTDDEIETRHVEAGKAAWETPRLRSLSIGGSSSGDMTTDTEAALDAVGSPDFVDTTAIYAPSS